jgi:flavin-dependent dehydrogenase
MSLAPSLSAVLEPLLKITEPPGPFRAWDGTIWDAIVVGAGPAGALATHQLAQGGARVLLVDKKHFPRSKVCGACLSGQALAVLRSAGLGSLVAGRGGIELKDLQLGFRGRTARLALPGGVAVSRARLDAELVAAATGLGAQFLQETDAAVTEVRGGFRHVRLAQGGQTIEAAARAVLIAAGFGRYGPSRDATAGTHIMRGSRVGAGCRVEGAPDVYGDGTIFMAVGGAGYVGMVRVEDGSLNVAAAFEPAFMRRLGAPGAAAMEILDEAGFEPIAALKQARWQGTPPLTRQSRPLAAERLFLLGDAAGYVEPFTGEGIAWALQSARAVAPLALQAIERWDPCLKRAWSQLHGRLIGRRQKRCRAVAMVLRRPWLAHLGFELCAWVPRAVGLVIKRWNEPSFLTNAS